MCGIAGLIDKRGSQVDPAAIRRMTDAVAHRGPDADGYYFGRSFAFGHRRLSILDLSTHGLQPMAYRDRYQLIYNGEIYNYIEIRSDLEKLGHAFGSGTDSEVILAAYAEWGSACCKRFNGMWAFAIFDSLRETIFLARDRFGVKPLYYVSTPDLFAFGSEIKQLLPLQGTVRANRSVVVKALLTSIDGDDEQTYFDGVMSFPQAHHGTYDLRTNELAIERYYELAASGAHAGLSREEAVAEFRRLFTDSVRIRLRSDVRVGTCLSGGLDSSAISGVASRMYHEAGHARFIGIHAKSIDAETDESRFARIAADHLAIELHVVEPSVDDFLATIDDLTDTQEEPFGSASMFMGWHVFQRAAELGCKVMLNGQGGDEVLLGYERYFAAYLRSVPVRRMLAEARAQARNSKLSLKDVLLYGLYFQSASVRTARLKRRSYLLPEIADSHAFDEIRRSAKSFRSVTDMQLLEIGSLQLPHLLRYEDRNSMRHSIETRLPFLDYRLVELCVGISPAYKIHDGWTKHLLREAMSDTLPPAIAWRRDKMGFEAPMRSWIGAAMQRMKREVAGSQILRRITDHRTLCDGYESLPLAEAWRYFNFAAWERRFGVAW